ncbi:hypothetical protein QUC31_005350 [Theobroma cacao]
MAGATKLQQSLQESCVLRTPKTEIAVKIEIIIEKSGTWIRKMNNLEDDPAPPASPERPDVWTEWRQQQWKSTLSKEELKQRCLRCKEMGHNYQHCPYPIIYVEASFIFCSSSQFPLHYAYYLLLVCLTFVIMNFQVPDENGGPGRVKPVVWQPPKGIYRCSRCGRRGHNRRTCHGPVFY